ncbi:MAG: TolC family protein [Pirellulales bacterium]|nr:TolC family protein [Pirellulales bacterium]
MPAGSLRAAPPFAPPSSPGQASDRAPAAPPAPAGSAPAAAPENVAPGGRQAALTLPQAQSLALGSHPRLRNAAASVQAAGGRAWQAGAYPNPSVFSASPQWSGAQSQYNVYLQQTLVTANKLRLDQAAAVREVNQAQFAWTRAHFDVLTGVRGAFYTLLVEQQRVSVNHRLVELTSRSYELAERMLKSQEISRQDVLPFGIERDRARLALLGAETAVIQARRELAVAMGIPQLEIGAINGDLAAPLPRFDLAALQQTVAANHADVGAARAAVSRNMFRLARARAEPIPDLVFQGGYQRQIEPAQDQALFQVGMVVPLWNRNQGAITAAQAEVAAARADTLRWQLDLAQQVADAWSAYEIATQQVETFQRQVLPKAMESVRLQQQRLARGEGDVIGLVSSQRTLADVELAALNAQQNRWQSAIVIADLLQLERFP